MSIIPVILSGGSGTRLWPLSRTSKPKQYLSFNSAHTLFQNAVLRCRGSAFDVRPIIVASSEHRFMVAENLLEIGVEAEIVLEPTQRNSCAAIAAACLRAAERDPGAVVLALAADHHIPDGEAFAEAALRALPDAQAGQLVLFGIRPDRPATGYGYIRIGEPLLAARRVVQFDEKPDLPTAEAYVELGYLWNSGNFLFRADAFLGELERLQPDILHNVARSIRNATADFDFLRLDPASFAACFAVSVDKGVMEKTALAAVLPVNYAWSDIGSWDSAACLLPEDNAGNRALGDVVLLRSRDNIVHSEERLTAVLGMNGATIVATRDHVLVAGPGEGQNVRILVEELRRSGRIEAVEGLRNFRPWGHYERLDIGERYQVKRLHIKPGGVLSLQKHAHRAEHWIVICGSPEIEINGVAGRLEPNESIHVPPGAVHRLANRSREPVILIEVQTGGYLGEDDIVRLQDEYNRTGQNAAL